MQLETAEPSSFMPTEVYKAVFTISGSLEYGLFFFFRVHLIGSFSLETKASLPKVHKGESENLNGILQGPRTCHTAGREAGCARHRCMAPFLHWPGDESENKT